MNLTSTYCNNPWQQDGPAESNSCLAVLTIGGTSGPSGLRREQTRKISEGKDKATFFNEGNTRQ